MKWRRWLFQTIRVGHCSSAVHLWGGLSLAGITAEKSAWLQGWPIVGRRQKDWCFYLVNHIVTSRA